jgi:type VI protein secretion system component Hcp
MMNTQKIVSVLLAGVLSVSTAMASNSLYMKVPGVTGPSVVKGYEGWIEVLSFSLGFQANTCSSLSVMKQLDITSPALTMAAVAGTFYPTVTLVSVHAGERPYEEFRLKLFNAVVTSVQESGASETPVESLSFQPSSVELTYFAQMETGQLTPVTSTVDCQKIKVK